MLNVLSGFELAGLDPVGAPRLHLEIEASRLAFRDRDTLIGDTDHVPVTELLSKEHADLLRGLIDLSHTLTVLTALEISTKQSQYNASLRSRS